MSHAVGENAGGTHFTVQGNLSAMMRWSMIDWSSETVLGRCPPGLHAELDEAAGSERRGLDGTDIDNRRLARGCCPQTFVSEVRPLHKASDALPAPQSPPGDTRAAFGLIHFGKAFMHGIMLPRRPSSCLAASTHTGNTLKNKSIELRPTSFLEGTMSSRSRKRSVARAGYLP